MNLAEILEEQADEIVGVRTLRVARDLQALPGADIGEKFAPQFLHFLAQPFHFGRSLWRGREAAQLLHVALERGDGALALPFLLARALCAGIGSQGFVFFPFLLVRLREFGGLGGRFQRFFAFPPAAKPLPKFFSLRHRTAH